MPVGKLAQPTPQKAPGHAYNRDMKTIQHLDMSSFMEAYTAQMIAEAQRRQAIREGRLPKPQPTTVWNISDRH